MVPERVWSRESFVLASRQNWLISATIFMSSLDRQDRILASQLLVHFFMLIHEQQTPTWSVCSSRRPYLSLLSSLLSSCSSGRTISLFSIHIWM
jgi:hypothetical protein